MAATLRFSVLRLETLSGRERESERKPPPESHRECRLLQIPPPTLKPLPPASPPDKAADTAVLQCNGCWISPTKWSRYRRLTACVLWVALGSCSVAIHRLIARTTSKESATTPDVEVPSRLNGKSM